MFINVTIDFIQKPLEYWHPVKFSIAEGFRSSNFASKFWILCKLTNDMICFPWSDKFILFSRKWQSHTNVCRTMGYLSLSSKNDVLWKKWFVKQSHEWFSKRKPLYFCVQWKYFMHISYIITQIFEEMYSWVKI